jgi:uncharacterized protein YifE (UPF0438 family)
MMKQEQGNNRIQEVWQKYQYRKRNPKRKEG